MAATWTSRVSVAAPEGGSREHTITMNEPLTAGGMTFYQSGFDPASGETTLGVRSDPGWPVKYAGCGLIVGGIFTMFYMRAYFQKPKAEPVADARVVPEPRVEDERVTEGSVMAGVA